ncbi:ATP-binding domain-containing protein [Niallia sp. FSL R7-0648]|uniref:DEAD/DEAH box helicase n=1 Tax=Niallia sp. FSL R7-0648 TaxID=2954521 RepID=UPI0030FB82CF
MVTVIPGTSTKPEASRLLADYFEGLTGMDDTYLYTGYPIIGTANGPYPIDAVFLSSKYGLVIIDLIEGKDITGYEEKQDESYNKMESKLRNYKELTSKRQLRASISVVTFAPTVNNLVQNLDYPIYNMNNLDDLFDDLEESPYTEEDFKKLLSVLQSISTIRNNRTSRKITKKDSRGDKLRKVEDSIANLDNQQSRAVIETVDGVQRIRGLAGSGKTIVLALKAAYLHAQHPDWKIAVTFNTRALKGQIRDFISTFYIEQTNQPPNWDNLNIIHAWGAPGGGEKNGLYYTFCQHQEINKYKDFREAANIFGYDHAFSGVCKEAIENMNTSVPLYDALLVDEAQDFSKYFLRICYEFLKEPKRLVYAYDELQNLSGSSLPSPEEIFGILPSGKPKVKFDETSHASQDIILEKCYRNPRPTLVTAHALGFGVYRNVDKRTGTGLVQMFDNKELWTEVGYRVAEGDLSEGHEVVLKRDEKSSPKFLEEHSSIDDLIQFNCFEREIDQTEWLVSQIVKNIEEDELLPTDIIVINPDPLKTKGAVAAARAKLYELGYNTHIAGVASPDVFFENANSVTFTGIYRAKGNEAAMVYIINGQDCYESFGNLPTVRNRLFTAITRSKAWVRVLGVGTQMEKLITEYKKVKNHNYTLEFNYPTKEQQKNINLINRDMSVAEKKRVKDANKSIGEINKILAEGLLNVEDIDEEQRKILLSLLKKSEVDADE